MANIRIHTINKDRSPYSEVYEENLEVIRTRTGSSF